MSDFLGLTRAYAHDILLSALEVGFPDSIFYIQVDNRPMHIPLENMQSFLGCPICSPKNQPTKVVLLEEGPKRSVLHLTCETCGAKAIITVSMGQFGLMSMGVLSDLEQGEAKAVFKGEAVTSDQVLEVHQFLKDFSGGVEALTK